MVARVPQFLKRLERAFAGEASTILLIGAYGLPRRTQGRELLSGFARGRFRCERSVVQRSADRRTRDSPRLESVWAVFAAIPFVFVWDSLAARRSSRWSAIRFRRRLNDGVLLAGDLPRVSRIVAYLVSGVLISSGGHRRRSYGHRRGGRVRRSGDGHPARFRRRRRRTLTGKRPAQFKQFQWS